MNQKNLFWCLSPMGVIELMKTNGNVCALVSQIELTYLANSLIPEYKAVHNSELYICSEFGQFKFIRKTTASQIFFWSISNEKGNYFPLSESALIGRTLEIGKTFSISNDGRTLNLGEIQKIIIVPSISVDFNFVKKLKENRMIWEFNKTNPSIH